MNRSSLLFLVSLSLCIGPLHAASTPQTTAPKTATPAYQVAFVGDQVTFDWGKQPQFQAHSNWLPYGSAVSGQPGNGSVGTNAALQAVQTIISSGKKPIIVLLVGESNAEGTSPGNQHSSVFAEFAAGWEEVITTAQQARLPVIVGTIPYGLYGDISVLNKWIFTYAAAHNIPVVNYDFALNGYTGFAGYGHTTYGQKPGSVPTAPVYWVQDCTSPTEGCVSTNTLSSAGWDLMTDMVSVAIGQTQGVKLVSGWLDTVVYNGNEIDYSVQSGNALNAGGVVQFTAYGQYSDGSIHPFRNADFNGHIGTFTQTNPLAMTLDQTGAGWGMAQGATTVRFTTPAGVTLNGWTMTTTPSEYGCGNCIKY